MEYNVGEIFDSNNCGKFKITKIIDRDKREIEFLNTGTKKITYRKSIRTGMVKDNLVHVTKYDVGMIFDSNSFGKFKITKIVDRLNREIEFLDTGYKTKINIDTIKSGHVRDNYLKTVCNVGILGDCDSTHYLYSRWNAMLHRCYDKNYQCYETYGGSGVTVCDEWHYFENYIKDIESLHNSDKLKGNDSKNWHIDKDIKVKGNKIYSKDTVSIVKSSKNITERNVRCNKKPIIMLDLNDNIIMKFDSLKQATEFISPHLKYSTNITKCANGKIKTAYGYKWRYVKDEY